MYCPLGSIDKKLEVKGKCSHGHLVVTLHSTELLKYFKSDAYFLEILVRQSVAFIVSPRHAVISDCKKLKMWESVSLVRTQLRENRSTGLKVSNWKVHRESSVISLTYFFPWANRGDWECSESLQQTKHSVLYVAKVFWQSLYICIFLHHFYTVQMIPPWGRSCWIRILPV
jgi:hypothetical protein